MGESNKMLQNHAVAEAKRLLKKSKKVSVLTGAGISAESGIPTFRGVDGYWNGLAVTELASVKGFGRNPAKAWQWYHERRKLISQVEPNSGHFALTKLEQQFESLKIITQNVDGLHQEAGSRNVIELHGNIWNVKCRHCGTNEKKEHRTIPEKPICQICKKWLCPGVVLFGEKLPVEALEAATISVTESDVLLVVGTSSQVYPAAGFPELARTTGVTVIEINPDPQVLEDYVDLKVVGKSGIILPLLLS